MFRFNTQKGLFAANHQVVCCVWPVNNEQAGFLCRLSQTASKGVVSMEELRGQLGERLPIASAAMALAWARRRKSFIDLVESGRLGAQGVCQPDKGLGALTGDVI